MSFPETFIFEHDTDEAAELVMLLNRPGTSARMLDLQRRLAAEVDNCRAQESLFEDGR